MATALETPLQIFKNSLNEKMKKQNDKIGGTNWITNYEEFKKKMEREIHMYNMLITRSRVAHRKATGRTARSPSAFDKYGESHLEKVFKENKRLFGLANEQGKSFGLPKKDYELTKEEEKAKDEERQRQKKEKFQRERESRSMSLLGERAALLKNLQEEEKKNPEMALWNVYHGRGETKSPPPSMVPVHNPSQAAAWTAAMLGLPHPGETKSHDSSQLRPAAETARASSRERFERDFSGGNKRKSKRKTKRKTKRKSKKHRR